jgi:thiamine biosynthesis lipoprotein
MVLSADISAEALAPLLWSKDDWCRANFRAMGTHCQIIFRAPSRKQATAFRDQAVSWVADFERKYSRYREDSMISEINRAAGSDWVEIEPELESIFALCDHYHWSTQGVFDPTTLPLLKLWNYQVERPTLPGEDEVEHSMSLIGWQRVQRKPGKVHLPLAGMALDLGGIGKEYAVDRVMEQSRAFGINDILIDFGRDIRATGEAPQDGAWSVGLEHPLDQGRCWSGVLISNRAVTTSGDYVRGFEIDGVRYSHIIDPRTGRPVANRCHSASVIAPTCTEAGILSTTALILGPGEGLKLIERSCFAQGCLWQGEERHHTTRFASYLIP